MRTRHCYTKTFWHTPDALAVQLSHSFCTVLETFEGTTMLDFNTASAPALMTQIRCPTLGIARDLYTTFLAELAHS